MIIKDNYIIAPVTSCKSGGSSGGGGGGGGSYSCPSIAIDMYFASIAERDAFTAANPDRLYQGVTCAVVSGSDAKYDYYQYDTHVPAWREANRIYQGEQGEQGLKGDQGIQGIKGDTGSKGDKGDTGDRGPDGAKGDKGDTGDQGPKGDTGDQGPKGDPADVLFANVSSLSLNDEKYVSIDRQIPVRTLQEVTKFHLLKIIETENNPLGVPIVVPVNPPELASGFSYYVTDDLTIGAGSDILQIASGTYNFEELSKFRDGSYVYVDETGHISNTESDYKCGWSTNDGIVIDIDLYNASVLGKSNNGEFPTDPTFNSVTLTHGSKIYDDSNFIEVHAKGFMFRNTNHEIPEIQFGVNDNSVFCGHLTLNGVAPAVYDNDAPNLKQVRDLISASSGSVEEALLAKIEANEKEIANLKSQNTGQQTWIDWLIAQVQTLNSNYADLKAQSDLSFSQFTFYSPEVNTLRADYETHGGISYTQTITLDGTSGPTPPPPVDGDHTVYFGWHDAPITDMTDEQIKNMADTDKSRNLYVTESTLLTEDYTHTRDNVEYRNMYIAYPKGLVNPDPYKVIYSGFTATWLHTEITIDGIVYIVLYPEYPNNSPNMNIQLGY